MKKKEKIRYSGVSTVEAAIVFPVLLLITFGAIEYGWMFLKAQQVTNAAREGARVAIRATTNDIELVKKAVKNVMTQANISDYDLIVPDGFADLAAGTLIRIRVSANYANLSLINFPKILVPDKLKASVTMAREGPG